jgi:hypothetical protein
MDFWFFILDTLAMIFMTLKLAGAPWSYWFVFSPWILKAIIVVLFIIKYTLLPVRFRGYDRYK